MGKNGENNTDFVRDLIIDSFYVFSFLVFFDIATNGWLTQRIADSVKPLVEKTLEWVSAEREFDKLAGRVVWEAMQTVEEAAGTEQEQE